MATEATSALVRFSLEQDSLLSLQSLSALGAQGFLSLPFRKWYQETRISESAFSLNSDNNLRESFKNKKNDNKIFNSEVKRTLLMQSIFKLECFHQSCQAPTFNRAH